MADPFKKPLPPTTAPKVAKDGAYWFKCMAYGQVDPAWSATIIKNFDSVESGEPQVRFIIKVLRKQNATLELLADRSKNDAIAQSFTDRGNSVLMANGHPDEIAEWYTQAIAYAIPGTPTLALGYANRSVVSFNAARYQDCLDDIERALQLHYPDALKAKLHARKLRCLVTLKKPRDQVDQALKDTKQALLSMPANASGRKLIEKVLTQPDHMALGYNPPDGIYHPIPTIQDNCCEIRGATGIAFQTSQRWGRHIIATRDIRPGEIIAVTDVYVQARSPTKYYRHCADCSKPTAVGIPCDRCVNVVYCSVRCRDRSWALYHKTECSILGSLLLIGVPTSGIATVKMTLRGLQEAGGAVQLKNMLEKFEASPDHRLVGFTDGVFDCSKFAAIYSLIYCLRKRRRYYEYYSSVIAVFVVYYMATRSDVFGKKYEPGLHIFKDPLLSFFAGLMVKTSGLIQMSGADLASKEVGHHDSFLSPFLVMCKHSCVANVAIVGKDRKSMMFAVEPIREGQQLFNNYMGLLFWKYPKAERQQKLYEEYRFHCECVPCAQNWPLADKLPSVMKVTQDLKVPIAVREPLILCQLAYDSSCTMAKISGNALHCKEDLVTIIETIFKYCYPSQEMNTYQAMLVQMMAVAYNLI